MSDPAKNHLKAETEIISADEAVEAISKAEAAEQADGEGNSPDEANGRKKGLLAKATTTGIAELLLLGMDKPSRGLGDSGPESGGETWAGRLVGDYRIEEELGRGGMGAVFRATNLRVGSTVALKLLRFRPGESAERLRRFELEAKAAAELNHPNIINVFDVGQMGDLYYLAMEYIEGRPLSEKIAAGPMDSQQVVRIALDVLLALDFAHSAGVIHRDIKPSNILIEPSGQAQLMDFGLARDMTLDSKKLTEAGSIMGTAHYMSPEQASGRSHVADSRSDIHSFGAVLYEMVTGVPPFDGVTQLDVLRKVVAEDPIRPSKLRPDLDRDLEVIITKAIEKNPARRYRSSKALRDDLQRFQSGEPILARPPSLLYRARKYVVKHRATTVPCTIALAAVIITGGLIVHERMMIKTHRGEKESFVDDAIKDIEEIDRLRWKEIHLWRLKDNYARALTALTDLSPTNNPREKARRALWRGILKLEQGDAGHKKHFDEAKKLAENAKRPEIAYVADLYLGKKDATPPPVLEDIARARMAYHQGHAAVRHGELDKAKAQFKAATAASLNCLESYCAEKELRKLENQQK